MKEWAFLLCKACAMTGIIEILLPKTKTKQCIKAVLTIYILVAVFGGTADFNHAQLLSPAAITLYEPNDYSEYTEALTLKEIEKSLATMLQENNISAELKVYAENELLVAETDVLIPQQVQHMIAEQLGVKLNFRARNNNG